MALHHYSSTQNVALRLNYIFNAMSYTLFMVDRSICLNVHLFINRTIFAANAFQSSAHLRLSVLLIASTLKPPKV